MKTFSTFLFSFSVFQYKNEVLRFYRHEDGNDEHFFEMIATTKIKDGIRLVRFGPKTLVMPKRPTAAG